MSIEISYKIEAFGHAYLVQSCSTAGEVISTAVKLAKIRPAKIVY